MTPQQELVLRAADNEDSARTLAEFWEKVQSSPLQAAKILRALEQSADAISKFTADIPEAWKNLDSMCIDAEVRRNQFLEDLRSFRKDTAVELTALAEAMTGLQKALAGINEGVLLNKANRIIEVGERLGQLKRDGSLELLKKLLL